MDLSGEVMTPRNKENVTHVKAGSECKLCASGTVNEQHVVALRNQKEDDQAFCGSGFA